MSQANSADGSARVTDRATRLRRRLSFVMLRSRSARRRGWRSAVVVLSVLGLALALSSPALAAGPPVWELESSHTPERIPLTKSVNQVETVTVEGKGATPYDGSFSLLFTNVALGEAGETKALPYGASAAEVRKALEAVKAIGINNVKVTGGPTKPHGEGEASWSYVVTFEGALAGREVELETESVLATELEEEAVEKAGGTPEEGLAETKTTTSGERDTVEYELVATNAGGSPSSGKVTVTDSLPAGLSTKATPGGVGWVCAPVGEAKTTVTCTTEKAVPLSARTEPITIEAVVDITKVKEGEQLTNKATISGGGAAAQAEAGEEPATVSSAPALETRAASSPTQTAATLHATVNPNGKSVSECKFEYGTTLSYGASAPCTPSPGTGTSPVEVSAAVAGLAANTEYHFRISAENLAGATKGLDARLKTLPKPPTVETLAASPVAQTSATLNASVNPNGAVLSECRFEYGTTLSYGASAPCASSPGGGTSPVEVSAALTGLAVNAEYHFRISATNPTGTSKGSDQTFRTQAPPLAPPQGSGSQAPPPNQAVLPFQERMPPVPDAELARLALTASASGAVSVRVSCPAAESSCAGTITLRTLNAVIAGARGHQSKRSKPAILTLTVGAFNVAGGLTATVTLHLSAKARTLLARIHALLSRATIVARDPAGSTHTALSTVTIRAAKATRRKG
jgi:uncharacterized repeat protein (TIGR01451 family)